MPFAVGIRSQTRDAVAAAALAASCPNPADLSKSTRQRFRSLQNRWARFPDRDVSALVLLRKLIFISLII